MPQSVIDFEYLGAVDEGRIRVGLVRAVGDIAGRKIAADVTDVELILKGHLHLEASESDRAGRATGWIDARDARDEEVRLGQVENAAIDQSCDGACGVDLCGYQVSKFFFFFFFFCVWMCVTC